MSLESIFKLSLVMNMVDHLSGPLAGIASRVGADVTRLDNLSRAFGSTLKTGVAMQEMGAQITGAVLAPVEATFETRRALGELASLGVEDMDALENAARSFSDQWAGTTKADFISAAYDIKSGISSLSDEGVAEFTGLAALTAKATKATAAEMTSLFASGYGIYKGYYDDLTDIQFGEMFSAGIAESVRAFKTSGSGMAQGIQSLGASATTANVPLEEQLAILGMLQATMGGAEAGTKYKAFLQSAAKAGDTLGLEFLDANGQLRALPEILSQLRGRFGETMDAVEKMELQKAFGSAEAVAVIDLLYSKTGDLQDNILNLYGAMGQGTSVAQNMASAIQETEPERYERLRQRIHNVTESIGGMLLPAVNDLLDKGEQVLAKAASWIEENEVLVKTIMTIVLGLGLFLTAAGTVIAVVSGIGFVFTRAATVGKIFFAAIKHIPSALEAIQLYGMFAGDAIRAGFGKIRAAGSVAVGAVKNVTVSLFNLAKGAVVSGVSAVKNMAISLAAMAKQAVTTAASALAPLISSVWSFTAALLANPITWVAIGIAVLIVALVLLWTKCEWFRNGVLEILDNIRQKFDAAVSFAAGVFTAVRSAISSALDAACSAASEKLDNMKMAYEEHGGGIQGAAAATMEGVKGVFSAGYNFLGNLTGGKLTGIKDRFSEKLSPITDISGSILNAARATVSEKLGNMRTAYEQHGGGVQGIAAAALEGVKGYYTAGFTFLDHLTGGKLSEIGGGFSTGMGGMVQSANQKLAEVRMAFLGGLNSIRSMVGEAVSWFFDSGRKVVATFANGIRSAFSGAVDTVRGGLQKIRNLLPFSDAREGPLSTLTLSGQRTMTTYANGLALAQDAPAAAMERGLRGAKAALEWSPVEKVRFSGDGNDEGSGSNEGADSGSGGKQINIKNLIIRIDPRTMKDLQAVFSVIREIEDYTNGYGEDPDEDLDLM